MPWSNTGGVLIVRIKKKKNSVLLIKINKMFALFAESMELSVSPEIGEEEGKDSCY